MPSFCRRLWARVLVAALAGLASFACVAWFAWARPFVAETMTGRIGFHVSLGRLYPSWNRDGLILVARDVVVLGRKPFHQKPLALCDRVEIQLSPHPTVWVDGLELRVLVAPTADNVRGFKAARVMPKAAGHMGRSFSNLPVVHVRSGRASVDVALSGGGHISARARNTEFSNRGRAFDLRLGDVAVDVANVATARLQSIDVEGTTGGDLLVHAENLSSNLPGGGPLFKGLALDASLHDEGWSLSAQAKPGDEAQMAIHAQSGAGGVSLQTNLDNWPLASLSPLLDGLGLGMDQSQARGSLKAHFQPGQTAISWQLQVGVRNASSHHPALDRAVWRGIDVSAEAQGRFDWSEAKLEVTKARVAPLGLPLDVSGWVTLGSQPRGSWSLHSTGNGWPCATLVNHVPASVQKALRGLNLQGQLSLGADVSFDSSDWDKLTLDMHLLPSTCEVLNEPATLAANLQALQVAHAPLATRPELPVSLAQSGFTPLQKIPVHVIAAFLTAEDAGFFMHKGFELDNIRRALIYNIERGRFVRGASTITQQVAKNLFLTHERTLSRKFVEAVLSWRLEELVPKRRLLEMYLNLVELGPGIRGVGEAARAYFGKQPGTLTPLEAAHLASLPPNPRGFARRFREGSVDEGWLARLYDLVGMMGRRGHLSAAEVAAAQGSRLRLRKI